MGSSVEHKGSGMSRLWLHYLREENDRPSVNLRNPRHNRPTMYAPLLLLRHGMANKKIRKKIQTRRSHKRNNKSHGVTSRRRTNRRRKR